MSGRAIVLLTIFLVVASVADIQAQDENSSASFAEWLETNIPVLSRDYSVPGVGVAVWEGGALVFRQGFGKLVAGGSADVNENTVFHLGGISKTITAWAILNLVEKGQLDLDKPAEDYLTRWTIPASSFGTSGVTLRRILNHTSGLGVESYDGFDLASRRPDLAELLAGEAGAESVTVEFAPGSKWGFSEGGYAVAQLVVEEVTGEPFDEYVTKSIFQKLGMSSTTYQPSATGANASTGHNTLGLPIEQKAYTALAASSVFSTLEDFSRFVEANIGSESVDLGGGVLEPSSVIQTQTPTNESNDSYGLGYSVRYLSNGKAVVGHGGASEGWQANVAMIPASGDAIVIFTNGTNGLNLSTAIRCEWYSRVDMAPPAEACYGSVAARLARPYRAEGVGAALSLYDNLKESGQPLLFDEWELNGFGYDVLATGNKQDALQIFKKNVREFPNASNPFDSLGEIYMELGQRDSAAVAFRKSLELDPSNTNAAEMLRHLGSL